MAHDNYRAAPVAEALANANTQTAVICLIETADGAENADAIAAIDGVDCLWVGHFDLSVSLGIPGEFSHPKFQAAMDKIIGAAKKHGKSLGRLVANTEQGIAFYKQGFDFICYSGDVWVLRDGLAAAAKTIREGVQGMSAYPRRAVGRFQEGRWLADVSGFRSGAAARRRPMSRWYSSTMHNPLRGDQLEDFDALILLAHRFDATSVPKSGRLAVVARFGVGYDTVDVAACTANDIALVITPDGVRRPVAVSIITFMLALTGKMMVKDKLARMGRAGLRGAWRAHGRGACRQDPGFARRRQHRGRNVPAGEALRHALHRP